MGMAMIQVLFKDLELSLNVAFMIIRYNIPSVLSM